MGMNEKRPLAVVFAGCGGTFYHAHTLYATLLKKYAPALVALVDPDSIEAKNHTRQWVGQNLGIAKVHPALESLGLNDLTGPTWEGFISPLPPKTGYMQDVMSEALEGHDVIVVSNVDNHKGRLAIRDWVRARDGENVMIVSGCDEGYGQVWIGRWKDQDPIHDWLLAHPEVARGEEELTGVYGQNPYSNAITGFLTAHALEDALQHFFGWEVSPQWETTERYWKGQRLPKHWQEALEPHTFAMAKGGAE